MIEKPRSTLPPLTVRGPRSLQKKVVHTDAPGDPPLDRFPIITRPEWYVYWYLESRKRLTPGRDFEFQSSLEGGRQILGGLVVDFLLFDRFYPRGLVINVQGEFWHRFRSRDRANDLEDKVRLVDKGFTFVGVLEDDIIRELENGGYSRTLELALRGIQTYADRV